MAPNATRDHMVAWHTERKVLISGDNRCRSFPNLCAVRGTAYRDLDTWADTVDVLLAFEPEVLGPGGTKPFVGAGAIKELLTDYRDAIRHVVDTTRGGTDEGMAIDELPHAVTVPEELAKNPCRREHYCRMDFAARACFVGTMGWLDGNPTSPGPLSPKTEAERFIKPADGPDTDRAEPGTAR